MKALLVIDMIGGFVDEGTLKVEGAKNMLPFINDLIQHMEHSSLPVFYIADEHRKNDFEMSLFPAHCLGGTSEALPCSGLHITNDAETTNHFNIKKRTIDCFYETNLEKELWNEWVAPGDEVGVVGVVTELCVDAAVRGLAKRGFKPVVFDKGIMGLDDELSEATKIIWQRYFGAKVVQ